MALFVALIALAWLALVVAAPVLPAGISATLYAVTSLICHQRPERSFHLDAFQLPVCARCLGIYGGAALGAVAVIWADREGRAARHAVPWALTAAAFSPTVLTVALEWAGVWPTSNLARAMAGAPAGAVVAFVVTRALATVHYDRCAPPRPTVPNPPLPPT